jgi:hypothetical protein
MKEAAVKRYCVSQRESNVIYLYATEREAGEQVRQLSSEKSWRWSFEPKERRQVRDHGQPLVKFSRQRRDSVDLELIEKRLI